MNVVVIQRNGNVNNSCILWWIHKYRAMIHQWRLLMFKALLLNRAQALACPSNWCGVMHDVSTILTVTKQCSSKSAPTGTAEMWGMANSPSCCLLLRRMIRLIRRGCIKWQNLSKCTAWVALNILMMQVSAVPKEAHPPWESNVESH